MKVFLSVSKSKYCPSLLRDLLAKKELEETFSSVAVNSPLLNPTHFFYCLSQMCLLQCLIGPPSGINLRNTLWHGFADHREIPYK